MAMIVLSNKKGFSLIELLVAMFILVVVLLGLLLGLIIVKDNQIRSLLREEGVKLAQERLVKLKNGELDPNNEENPNGCVPSAQYARLINKVRYNYGISQKKIAVIDQFTKISLEICWDYKGKNYNYKIETLVKKE